MTIEMQSMTGKDDFEDIPWIVFPKSRDTTLFSAHCNDGAWAPKLTASVHFYQASMLCFDCSAGALPLPPLRPPDPGLTICHFSSCGENRVTIWTLRFKKMGCTLIRVCTLRLNTVFFIVFDTFIFIDFCHHSWSEYPCESTGKQWVEYMCVWIRQVPTKPTSSVSE